jgi:hypothetical protein
MENGKKKRNAKRIKPKRSGSNTNNSTDVMSVRVPKGLTPLQQSKARAIMQAALQDRIEEVRA